MKKAKTIWRDTVKENTEESGETQWRRVARGGETDGGREAAAAQASKVRSPAGCWCRWLQLYSNVFKLVSKPVQMCSKLFKLVQMCSNLFKGPKPTRGCRCRWLQGDAETEIVAFSLVVPSNVLLQVYNTHWCHTFLSPACQNLQINMSQEINLSFNKIADL